MKDQVEEIKNKIDIVSLIGERITLKKAGKNYKAPCPFHSEKIPSFNVSPDLQIYKCFGCGESGDAFTFLEKYEGMDFYEALKHLAVKAGVELKPTDYTGRDNKQKLYEINFLASRFYSYVLLSHPEGKRALDYLIQKRGLKIQTIKTFGIGYSPDKPFALVKYLHDKKKINPLDIEKTGIIYSKGGYSVDRFRGRVVFPLIDHRNNVCGFSGRITPWMEGRELAKYINTPETPIYSKSKMLFGLNIVKGDIKRTNNAIITEGELDMISSWQGGVKNTLAIKGSVLTQEQVKLISRYSQNIILALDSDLAGDAASRRGIEIAQKEGLNIKVAILGSYKDPDDFARSDINGYKQALRKAVGVYDFIIESIFNKFPTSGGLAASQISKMVVPILSEIPDKIVQAHYIKTVAEKLDISLDAVSEQLKNYFARNDNQNYEIKISTQQKTPRTEILELRLLKIIFNYDAFILRKKKYKNYFSTSYCQKITKKFSEYAKKHKDFDTGKFARFLPAELVEIFNNFILEGVDGIDGEREEEYEKELKIIEQELDEIRLRNKLKEIVDNMKRVEDDSSKLEKLSGEFSQITAKIKALEDKSIKGIILEKS